MWDLSNRRTESKRSSALRCAAICSKPRRPQRKKSPAAWWLGSPDPSPLIPYNRCQTQHFFQLPISGRARLPLSTMATSYLEGTHEQNCSWYIVARSFFRPNYHLYRLYGFSVILKGLHAKSLASELDVGCHLRNIHCHQVQWVSGLGVSSC